MWWVFGAGIAVGISIAALWLTRPPRILRMAAHVTDQDAARDPGGHVRVDPAIDLPLGPRQPRTLVQDPISGGYYPPAKGGRVDPFTREPRP